MARARKTNNAQVNLASGSRPWLRWLFQPLRLLRVALLAGVAAASPYVVEKLPDLSQRSEYRIALSQVQLVPPPAAPVPLNLIDQVAEQSGLPDELSLLENSLTDDLAAAFGRHPWVAEVVQVRKSFPASVTIELKYRRPVLLANVPGGQVPLDANGIVLPTADFSPADKKNYPTLRNVSALPRVRAGMVWSDPAILAAARLAETLADKWQSLKFEAISIPREVDPATEPHDVLLELVGQGGSHIVWGRPPGSDHPGELEASQKIRRLEKYLADFGDYAQPNGPYEIDIRHWQEISRRRLSTEQVQVKPAKPGRPDSKPRSEPAPRLREAGIPEPGRIR
ncbi:cell division protein FtsQ/DivIB [Schlesneria sp. DSM 10557]|uniref:cell division protein FtsQ/DivIB n=1 Tax=Schlesneria sp. DSM 10557 TaxID=3044399 RepID=UPI00359FE672